MKNRKLRKYLEKYKKANKEQIINDSLKRHGNSKNKVCTVILGLMIASMLSACSASSSLFGGSDIQISASEAGMKAYGDHISAIITNSKAPDDAQDTPAYELRRTQMLGQVEMSKYRYGVNTLNNKGQ